MSESMDIFPEGSHVFLDNSRRQSGHRQLSYCSSICSRTFKGR